MAMVQEWIKRRYTSFNTVIGEEIVAGDPIDVTDWDIIEVQVDVVGSNAAADTDITWVIETCISPDEYPKWQECFTDKDLPATTGESSVARIDTSSTNPLRAWARLKLTHTVTTASQNCTIHVNVLYKQRVR